MYTDNELQISNKSFTSKDFNTIYPELLDLVKKLTNKWDPTTSNESDPGVVLLKLWSILADKNNYNIDKNILETFPLSVTQLANAHKLYDMLGYRMHYYKSAVTELNMWYIGSDLSEALGQQITIPRYTMVTDDSGQVVYTIISDVTFAARNTLQTVQAIEGTILDYEVNGVSTITLDNLDSEYRLFFTESMIAENGIFISNKSKHGVASGAVWEQVDNLESYRLNSKIFKFGVMPNSNTCYIQFPQDIGTLIENGLSIKYVITSGSAGNIQKEVLTTLYEDVIPEEFALLEGTNDELAVKAINSDVVIKNPNPASNGMDPEDIDSAYRNYKKTVGTFNTLVTTEDYEKAIFNLDDGLGQHLASNAVVSDRTTDLNRSIMVKENTSAGVQDLLYPVDSSNELTAFDIGLYVLDPMKDIYTDYYYNKSFSTHSRLQDVKDGLEDCKSIGHNYIDTESESTKPYIFKNFYTLTGKVTTFYKVTAEQAEDIEKNIMTALYKKFNAREIDFGQAINYDTIIKTIQEADTRINSVILNEPEYDVRYMLNSDFLGTYDKSMPLIGKSTNGSNDYSLLVELLAKMVVGGHVQLYKFNTDVEFDFGQTEITAYEDISSVTTVSAVAVDALVPDKNIDVATEEAAAGGGYIVQKNQNIQLFAPNLYAKTAYTAYVNYYFKGNGWTKAYLGGDGEEVAIQQNKYYVTDTNRQLYIQYTDENNTAQYRIYGDTSARNGRAIFRYKDSNDSENALAINPEVRIKKDINFEKDVEMGTLVSTEQIEIMEFNEVTLDDPTISCLWFTNTQEKTKDSIKYILFPAGETQKILQENEYFMYTNKDKDELVIVGSGTLLVRGSANSHNALVMENNLAVEDVIENGQTAISDIDWYKLSSANQLTLVELQIVTLGEGAALRISKNADDSIPQLGGTVVNGFSVALVDVDNCSVAKAVGEEDPHEKTTVYRAEPKITHTTPHFADRTILRLSGLDTTTVVSNTVYFAFEQGSIPSKIGGDTLTKVNPEKTFTIETDKDAITYVWYSIEVKDGASVFDVKFESTDKYAKSFYFSATAYKEGNYLTSSPVTVNSPSYAEDASNPVWIKLDDYTSLAQACNDKQYNVGWSCASRYNVQMNTVSAQDVKETATSNPKTNQAIKLAQLQNEDGTKPTVLLPCIEGKKVLSNTVFTFAGGNDISIAATDETQQVNMYAYTEVALPVKATYDSNGAIKTETVTESENTVEIIAGDEHYTRNGDYIDVLYQTSHLSQDNRVTISTTNDNMRTDMWFKFSVGAKAAVDYNESDRPDVRYRIPVSISGKYTAVTIDIVDTTGVKIGGTTSIILYALPPSASEHASAVIEYEGNNFGGIKISSWSKVGSLDEVAYSAIQDTLRIGKPRIQFVSETDQLGYSDQLTSTVEHLAESNKVTEVLTTLQTQLAKDGYKQFDTSYIIKDEDAIDTDLSIEAEKYNLFNGLALWDTNHICNKYTIAQLNTKKSSIKVSTLSIKK